MTSLHRVRCTMARGSAAPGVSTFYFLDMATALESLFTFWTAVKPFMPSGVVYTIEPAGDVISDVTGTIVGAWGGTPQAQVTATTSANYAAAAGAHVRWNTATIMDGRRLRGRTFIVPLTSTSFESNGTLSPATLTGLQAAALQFVISQSSSFVIWHRPVEAKPADGSRKAVEQRDGGHGLVTASAVPDIGTVLRSRR